MLKKLLSPPDFDDQEQQHTASQLWTVVMVMSVMSTIYLAAWLMLSPERSIRVLFALPLYPLFAGALYLIRKGKTRIASGLLVWGIWVVLLVAATESGGVLAPGYGGLLIAVLAAGIFMGKNWALIVASVSVLAGALLVHVDSLGLMTESTQYTNATTMWIAQSLFFFIAASLLQMATRRISSALQRAENEIEERRKTEEQLREAEKRYRDLVEQVPAVIYIAEAGAEGDWYYVSPRIEALTGFTSSEWMADQLLWYSRIHPEDREATIENEKLAIQEKRQYQTEYRFTRKDGSVIWIRDESLNIPEGTAAKQNVVQGLLLDITRQKQMEEQRESLIRELESKNSELERFTYTVSHDLKAPLITMSGFLGYLEEDALSGKPDRLRSDIQRIMEANLKMQRLLNELLELSRIGRLMNAPETIPFGQIVEEALSRVEGRLAAKNIQVRVDKNLPLVHGDRIRLVEVMQNLVDNAAKFMGTQTNPKIEIGVETTQGEEVFFVRDNGIGIEPKFHKKVFELFDKLNPGIEGTGVGLALVKRIVEVHGGRIWIESELGMGTTIHFTLSGVPH